MKVISQETSYVCPVFLVEQLKYDTGQTMMVQKCPSVVHIAPYIKDSDRYILIEEFRAGAEEVLLTFPAGKIDAGESSLIAAYRECIEETGYVPLALELIHEGYTNPGISDEYAFFYKASVRPATNAEMETHSADEHENIQIRTMTTVELRKKLGDIKSIKSFLLANLVLQNN